MTLIMSVVYSLGVLIWAKDPLLFWIQGLLRELDQEARDYKEGAC